jgi:hypothetical protein
MSFGLTLFGLKLFGLTTFGRFWQVWTLIQQMSGSTLKEQGSFFTSRSFFHRQSKVCCKTALFGRKVIQVLGNFGRLFNKCLAAVVLF